jgi:hypothetical protein
MVAGPPSPPPLNFYPRSVGVTSGQLACEQYSRLTLATKIDRSDLSTPRVNKKQKAKRAMRGRGDKTLVGNGWKTDRRFCNTVGGLLASEQLAD